MSNNLVDKYIKKEKMNELEVMISGAINHEGVNEEEIEGVLLNQFLNILQNIKHNFE
jgi:hypothetical protein